MCLCGLDPCYDNFTANDDQLGAGRIQVDVGAGNLKVCLVAAVQNHGLEAALKEVSKKPMAMIVTAGISALQPLHADAQVGLGRLQEQVISIASFLSRMKMLYPWPGFHCIVVQCRVAFIYM
jgi:hypothetical protein